MATTENCDYAYVVKETGEGIPWIAFEPRSTAPAAIGDSLLGFDLKADSSYEDAERIAEFLNNNIDSFTITSF